MPEAAEIELRAQIDRARSAGIDFDELVQRLHIDENVFRYRVVLRVADFATERNCCNALIGIECLLTTVPYDCNRVAEDLSGHAPITPPVAMGK